MRTGLIKYALVVSVATSLTGLTVSARADDNNVSSSSTTTSSKADHKTMSFLKDAARDNDAEIALAELGLRKAQNPELKSFCQMLKQDHTQAGQQLQPIAQKYGLTTDASLNHKENKELSKLEKESGAKFDQEFATLMLKDHEKDIKKFQEASTKLQEPDVKQFAEQMLPKLREHFQHAETVARTVGVSPSTISSYSKRVNGGAVGGTGSDTQSSSGFGSSSESSSTNALDRSSSSGSGARDLKSSGSSSGQ